VARVRSPVLLKTTSRRPEGTFLGSNQTMPFQYSGSIWPHAMR
jgi:hypothetical protein